MRYVYQQVPVRAVTQQTTVVGTPRDQTESGIEVYVDSATYDSILMVLRGNGTEVVPADIAANFEHRGSFTVICDPTVA